MEFTAFCVGINLTCAVFLAIMWDRSRERGTAAAFWFNLVVGVLNALVWWAGS